MRTERYNTLRKELIRIYKVLTERTFVVYIQPTAFLSLKQLENAKERPPLTGFETYETMVERPYTIAYLLRAFDIMGDKINMGYRFPREDIPVVYETVQDWIRYWIEIKQGCPYIATPSIEELSLIEQVARHAFTGYAHYYHERINDSMRVYNKKELSLLDVLRGKMQFGDAVTEPISYISHIDQYKSDTGYRSGPSYNTGNGGIDFLKGFGGGM